MVKQSRIIVLLLVGVFALSMPLVYAVDEQKPEAADTDVQHKAEKGMQKLFKELNLTEEQHKQLEANKTKHREELNTLMQGMREKRELMRTEFQKDQINEAAVRGINNEIKGMQGRMADLRLEGMLSIRKILTPEQYKKFTEKMEQDRGQLKQRMNRHKKSAGGKEGCPARPEAGGGGPEHE